MPKANRRSHQKLRRLTIFEHLQNVYLPRNTASSSITEKRFTERPSPVPQVKAYSNTESTEHFVNRVSIGTVTAEKEFPTVFVWKNVELNTGKENVVTVRGYFADGNCLEDKVVWIGK